MPTFYSQNDPRYKNLLLGYNTASDGTIGRFGCLITGWGNMLNDITDTGDFDPVMMNNWLKTHNGFVPGGGIMYWSVPLGLGHIEARGTSTDLAYVNQWLKDPPNYALIEFNNGAHWSVAPVTGKVIDSNDGKLKPITSYKFTGAHLFRATGGKGAASVNNSEGPMTKEEEIEAYRRLLNHEPDIPVPSGRTAMQFIFDVTPFLQAERQQSHEVNATLQQENDTMKTDITNANIRISSLQSYITELEAQAKTAQITPPVTPAATLYEASEVPEARTRRVNGDHQLIDYTGYQPTYQLRDGMIWHQGSTFVVDGVVKSRSVRSAETGVWYGADESWFDDEPSTRSRPLPAGHVALSMGAGIAQKLATFFSGIFKPKHKE